MIRVVGTHTWQAGRERILREENLALPITYFFFLISVFKDMKKKDVRILASMCLDAWYIVLSIFFSYSLNIPELKYLCTYIF